MRDVLTKVAEQTAASPLADIDHQYRAVFDAVNDGIFISDPTTGRFIEINQAGCQMFGYHKSELIGCDIEMLSSGVYPYTQEEAIAKGTGAISGELQTFEWQCKTKAGDLFWAEISVRITQFGPIAAMVANVRDITERKKLSAEVEYMAHYDALTGLANRFMFEAALERAIAQSVRTGDSCAILLLDLDHFKEVNDTRGHAVGDRLLWLVAERLKAAVRVNEGVFRLGGDEFAILLNDPYEQAQIAALASRLIATVSSPFVIHGMVVQIGASIGMASHGPDACHPDTLMWRADIALYRAKAEGGQVYRFYCTAVDGTGTPHVEPPVG
jgi:diguanylate cyclase (GGDEF)-like protein/PAS domain S-box-containing protein